MKRNVGSAIVQVLNSSCNALDAVLYAEPVIRLTRPLPRWWRCELGRAARWLDERWQTGYWEHGYGPTADLCVVCQRRATWLVRSSTEGIDEPICWWCSTAGR